MKLRKLALGLFCLFGLLSVHAQTNFSINITYPEKLCEQCDEIGSFNQQELHYRLVHKMTLSHNRWDISYELWVAKPGKKSKKYKCPNRFENDLTLEILEVRPNGNDFAFLGRHNNNYYSGKFALNGKIIKAPVKIYAGLMNEANYTDLELFNFGSTQNPNILLYTFKNIRARKLEGAKSSDPADFEYEFSGRKQAVVEFCMLDSGYIIAKAASFVIPDTLEGGGPAVFTINSKKQIAMILSMEGDTPVKLQYVFDINELKLIKYSKTADEDKVPLYAHSCVDTSELNKAVKPKLTFVSTDLESKDVSEPFEVSIPDILLQNAKKVKGFTGLGLNKVITDMNDELTIIISVFFNRGDEQFISGMYLIKFDEDDRMQYYQFIPCFGFALITGISVFANNDHLDILYDSFEKSRSKKELFSYEDVGYNNEMVLIARRMYLNSGKFVEKVISTPATDPNREGARKFYQVSDGVYVAKSPQREVTVRFY